MESERTTSEVQADAENPEDRQTRMPNVTSAAIGSNAAILAWRRTELPKKRRPGRPKKPAPTLLTGLRIPKANGRPRHPVPPPGPCGAPKKYDAATMRGFVEWIDQRKSRARAEGCSISDDRAIRDDIIEHYQLEKRVARKQTLGLPQRAAEDRVFQETRFAPTGTYRTSTVYRRYRTVKVLLSTFRKALREDPPKIIS